MRQYTVTAKRILCKKKKVIKNITRFHFPNYKEKGKRSDKMHWEKGEK